MTYCAFYHGKAAMNFRLTKRVALTFFLDTCHPGRYNRLRLMLNGNESEYY